MPIEVGKRAPDFTLYDYDRKERNLKDLLGGKLILAFFPGAFTSVCTKEMCTFRDSIKELEALGAKVVGISVDSPFANKAFAEKNNLNFLLLSDYNREVIKKYDLVLENLAGLKGYTASKRAIFILDKEGIVRYKWVSDDPTKEPNYEEIKKVLKGMS
ncbi:Putative peroxiredoxin bcp [archaeon HR06]|nr:Putative peroxiredoxin bcp [archaeon HR06]